MLESCLISRNTVFYYDIEEKCIARFPSKSNLKDKGSDNSLYFGLNKTEKVCEIFKKIFNVKNLEEIHGKEFLMNSSYEEVNVVLNINADGQLQVKIKKDGTMNRLLMEFQLSSEEEFDINDLLIVVDFIKCEIRFKKYSDMKL